MSAPYTRETNGQFGKGNPGGPGRPRSAASRSVSALDLKGQEIAARVFDMISEKALAGDLKAAELLLSRVWPQRRARPLTVEAREVQSLSDYAPAAADITNAVLSGEATPQEGREMSALLRTQCDTIVMVDFEYRLREVEKAREEEDKRRKRSPFTADTTTVFDGFTAGLYEVED